MPHRLVVEDWRRGCSCLHGAGPSRGHLGFGPLCPLSRHVLHPFFLCSWGHSMAVAEVCV